MHDEDYYDNKINTKILVFVNLAREANRTVRDIKKCIEEIKKYTKKTEHSRVTKLLGIIQKISYNLRAKLDPYVEGFVDEKGIQAIMEFIDQAQELEFYDLVAPCLQMLSNILSYEVGIDQISAKKTEKFIKKFYELSELNQTCKKYSIRIFLAIIKSNLHEAFELIDKMALKRADEVHTLPF